jgi:hypothetical protein
MKPKAETLDVAQVLGYLGGDNVLYCSPACAAERGQRAAAPVDQEDYEAFIARGPVEGALLCPVCGSEYPQDLSVDRAG